MPDLIIDLVLALVIATATGGIVGGVVYIWTMIKRTLRTLDEIAEAVRK